jgi:hypothetical protein
LPYFYLPKFGDLYPKDLAQITIPADEHLRPPKGMPPVAWMACMGIHGEDNSFSDFHDFNITINNTVTKDVVRKMYRGYMSSVSYVDDQIGRMITALDRLGLRNSTIVTLW